MQQPWREDMAFSSQSGFWCNKEQHSTAVPVAIVFATIGWRSESGEATQGLFDESGLCRGSPRRAGCDSGCLRDEVTWLCFTSLTSKSSSLLTSGEKSVSTKPLWKDPQLDSCYVCQTFTALCWSQMVSGSQSELKKKKKLETRQKKKFQN